MKFPKIPYWPLIVGPALSFGFGFLLNALVMAANHAQMPVLMPGGDCSLIGEGDFIHSCMSAGTHLKFLADWIVINHMGIASPGDFLEWLSDATMVPGLFAWIVLVIRDHNKV